MIEDCERLREIQEEMLSLLAEAKQIIRTSPERRVFERARLYWIAHVEMGLTSDNDYLGNAAVSMDDTIDEFEATVE